MPFPDESPNPELRQGIKTTTTIARHRRRRPADDGRRVSAPSLAQPSFGCSPFRTRHRRSISNRFPAVAGGGGGARHGKARRWYELIESVYDYEEAWVACRDHMIQIVFEGMAMPMPYLRDALFYNLNAVLLEQKPSIWHRGKRTFHPAGPLRRLCSEVTEKTFRQISTARPVGVGPWLTTNHVARLEQKHNGVMKEIEVLLGNIFRAVNDDIPAGEYRVNKDTLAAMWASDEFVIEDIPTSPTSSEGEEVFESSKPSPVITVSPITPEKTGRQVADGEPQTEEKLLPISTTRPEAAGPSRSVLNIGSPLMTSTPVDQSPEIEPEPKRKEAPIPIVVQKKRHRRPKSIYVIHELIYAESVSVIVKIGKEGMLYQPPNLFRDKRAFPIGFALTKYDITKDGYLEKKGILRGLNLIGSRWNVVANVPWPPRPPDPVVLRSSRSKSTTTTSTGEFSGSLGSPSPGISSPNFLRSPYSDDVFESPNFDTRAD